MDNFNLKNYLKENVLNEGMLDNALDALYERLQNMAGEDLDDFLAFYAPDIDNRDANAITDWVYGLSEDDAQTILSDLQDYDELGGLKEEINLDIIDDYAILTGDSGKYEGEIEDDGTVSFSVIFDKQGLDTRIIDQYDESNIDEFLGKDHAFVELVKSRKYDYELHHIMNPNHLHLLNHSYLHQFLNI